MAETSVEAAPGDENDDSWLYGESTGDQLVDKPTDSVEKPVEQADGGAESGDLQEGEEKEGEDNEAPNDDEHFADVGRDAEDQNGDADSQNNGDSDSDDSDDIKVTIGEIKSGSQAYGSLNIKRGVGLVVTGAADKPRTGTTTGGKVTLEDLDGPGSINGVPAMEFNIDTIEDKPWNKPGADISDYFNYGFNEVTWSAYCERQRRMRVNEAGVALHVGVAPRPPAPDLRRPPGPVRNEEMPPPMANNYQARENTIQVMTAERREYGGRLHGREGGAPDYFGPPPPEHYYQPPPHPPYEEPWGHPEPTGWAPSDIKELTPGPGPGPGPGPMGPPPMGPPMMGGPLGPPHMGAPPHMLQAPPFTPPYRPPQHMHDRERDRDRDRDRERDRERVRERDERERSHRRDDEERDRERERERERSRSIKPDRIREKSYRRERSRSRSRRHKSRSRSPRQRERSRERERDRSRERERSRDRERSVKPKKDKEKEEEK